MVHGSTNGSSTETAALPEQVRSKILTGMQSWSDQEVTTEDLLRIYRDQVTLLFVTEQVRSAIAMDPFEHLRENMNSSVLEGILNSVTVTDHHSVHTMEGYVRIEATVRLSPLPQRSSRRKRTAEDGGDDVELKFQYTRPTVAPVRVSYTISMSSTDTSIQPQPLLWVYVDALGSVPSHRPAIRSEDDMWSDMDDNDGDPHTHHCSDDSGPDVAPPPPNVSNLEKEHVTDHREGAPPPIQPTVDGEDDQKADRYEAGMDAEVVSQLVQTLQLGSSTNDISIFFLLMTFPFYEHEWDIVGYLLEAVFDSDDEDVDDVVSSV